MTAQQLWDIYQAESEANGEWAESTHKAWEKWAMVAGKLRTETPVYPKHTANAR